MRGMVVGEGGRSSGVLLYMYNKSTLRKPRARYKGWGVEKRCLEVEVMSTPCRTGHHVRQNIDGKQIMDVDWLSSTALLVHASFRYTTSIKFFLIILHHPPALNLNQIAPLENKPFGNALQCCSVAVLPFFRNLFPTCLPT